jgi:predicted transposase/invertase (TIGR01784 family)
MGGEMMERIAEQEPMLRRAMTVEDIFMKNEEERRFYELREKGRRDYANAMLTSERRGEQKGMEKGLREGKQEGLREGEQKGKQEGLREGKKEIARSMLADAMSVDLISKFTGLTVKEIEAL